MKNALWKKALICMPLFAASAIASRNSSPFHASDHKAEFNVLPGTSLYIPMKAGVRIAIDVSFGTTSR